MMEIDYLHLFSFIPNINFKNDNPPEITVTMEPVPDKDCLGDYDIIPRRRVWIFQIAITLHNSKAGLFRPMAG